MAKGHEQEHEEVDDSPDHPEPDLENHFNEESYPMQDSEIGDLLGTHTHTLKTWHPHTIFLHILLPLMDL